MEDDQSSPPAGTMPVKDNKSEIEAADRNDIARRAKIDAVLRDIARLLGRRMAREQFEQARSSSARRRRLDED